MLILVPRINSYNRHLSGFKTTLFLGNSLVEKWFSFLWQAIQVMPLFLLLDFPELQPMKSPSDFFFFNNSKIDYLENR